MPDAGFGKPILSGDIAFLAKKEFDGKLRENEGSRSTIGTLATLTATSGKDMYLAKAKVNVFQNSNTAPTTVSANITIELQANGIVQETYQTILPWDTNPTFSPPNANYEFVISGIKVSATQVIKLEVTAIGVDVDVEGVITCFEETTGEDPSVV